MSRWAWAEVDLGAIEHNVRVLREAVAPSELWAVVKANGYGHGANLVAQAAVRAGATGLCVALVQEGVALRSAVSEPILVLSEQPDDDLLHARYADLTCTVYSIAQVRAVAASRDVLLERAGIEQGDFLGPNVHLKLDTGMRRVGADPDDAVAIADEIVALHMALEGVFTHLAIADEPDDEFTTVQLDRFSAAVDALAGAGHHPRALHAANSAGALAHPGARLSLVRVGIAIYGISPGPGVDHLAGDLRPAMSLRARVSLVKPVRAGERISYGLRHTFANDTLVATIPIGYADGVPRRLSSVGGEVLVGGQRRPIVGAVTMDQLMVDVGDIPVVAGDEVVLIGSQGDETITAADWAERLGTVAYEIVCGISPRIERRYI